MGEKSAKELISETHKDFLSLGNTHIRTKSILKREKGIEWTFPPKKTIYMANKHMKRCPMLLNN